MLSYPVSPCFEQDRLLRAAIAAFNHCAESVGILRAAKEAGEIELFEEHAVVATEALRAANEAWAAYQRHVAEHGCT